MAGHGGPSTGSCRVYGDLKSNGSSVSLQVHLRSTGFGSNLQGDPYPTKHMNLREEIEEYATEGFTFNLTLRSDQLPPPMWIDQFRVDT